jgi:hypothetical protein
MGLPSPFEVGRAIGNQGARGYSQAKDENLIEKIIAQTQNDPDAMQKAIGTILSNVSAERQPAAIDYLKNAYTTAREKQKEGRQRQAAVEAGISPDLPQALQVEQYKSKQEQDRMRGYGLIPGAQPQQANVPQQNVPTEQPQLGGKPQADANNPMARFSKGQLQQMAGDPSKRISEPAKQELKSRAEEEKLGNKKIELALGRDSKVMEEADKARALMPTEEAAIRAMKQAVIEGDQSFFSWNNLAELTGFEWVRDAQGGQFKTGAKTFLINNVTKFGARPNQYIEQQIADSLAKPGRGREANLASLAMTEFDVDMKRKYNQILDEVIAEDTYRPGTLAKEAQSRMVDYVERKQIELSNTLFQLANPLPQGQTYVYNQEGNIEGSINIDQSDELPEGYYVK